MEKQDLKYFIEKLFTDFLNEKINGKDNDIAYCLMQSSVEPTIRFKFGAWLNERYSERLTLNLMEANRIDLVIGIDDLVFVIEFGHLLNILKHDAVLNEIKIESDRARIESKSQKLIEKINKINTDYLLNKKICCVICSLFSDFKMEEKENKFHTMIDESRLKAGTLFKYGNNFENNEYFLNYQNHLNTQDKDKTQNYLHGYTESKIINGKLSLHYKFDIVNITF